MVDKMAKEQIKSWMKGATFSKEELMRLAPNMKTYLAYPEEMEDEEEPVEVHAIDVKEAKRVLKNFFKEGVRYELVQKKTSYKTIKV